MPPETAVVLALTTLPADADAGSFLRALLAARLIACGTIHAGARSLYHWEGQIEEAAEQLLLLKTTAGRLEALRAAFSSLHPYAVPELLILPVTDGLPAYLRWVVESVTTPGLDAPDARAES
jgi:periplasmic divalent cation tolerance protein